MLKKIFKNKLVIRIICIITYYYLRLVYKTTRWEIRYVEGFDITPYKEKPALYAFWHGRLLMMPYVAPSNMVMNVLISAHRDGNLISTVMKYFRFEIINGSNRKNASYALRNILKKLGMGQNVAITPDGGTRGPRMRINSNIINIAKISQVPILPITFAIKNCLILQSWDRLVIPFPFSKGIYIYGKPVRIDKNINEQESVRLRQELEDQLNAICYEADIAVGHQPILPN